MTLVAKEVKKVTVWRVRLPSEYQEVEYIQSSGTQYINTGWIPTIYDTIETKFQTQASASDTNLYGSRYNQRTGVRQDMSVRINTSSGKGIAVHYPISGVSSGLTDTGWFFTSDIINTPRVLKVTPKYCYVDGSIKYTFNVTRSEYTGDLSAYIFGKHEVGDYGDGSKLGKFTVYSFKIWTNDVLVRDLVPCYRKSDSVIGMYDLINDVFYTNEGTGTFTKGNDVGGLQEIKVRPAGGLPSAYQEVEYIQSSGTQWIDTGVTATTSTKAEIKLNSQYIAESAIFGSQWALNGCFLMFYNNRIRWHGASAVDVACSTNTDYTIETENGKVTVNGTSYTCTASSSILTGYNLGVFATGNQGSAYTRGKFKLYYFKIWDGATLQRDFIPCYRKADSVIGLYDLVNRQFYINSGTGTFTKGGDV